MSPLLEVTEDTPPDMLTGSMDLRLVLPDGNRVRMSVDRRTPMMDLLVQATTAYKISPAGNVLQPYGETGILPYKPSTPIGALDTWIVHIVPKNQAIQNPSNKINLKQVIPPFEQTLRFQVNLPRNQLYVTRVSGRCTMKDILLQACKEKNLDPNKYTLRHPKNLDKPLCEEMSIAEYGHNQVTMLSMKNLPTAVSTEDVLMMNKFKSQSDSGSGSAASSVSPIPPVQPAKPFRKRKPAPQPPAKPNQQQENKSETIICHSRTSSDSSGYHEASVLSESPDSNNSSLPDSLPRRSKLPSVETAKVESKLSRSLSNLHQASTSSAVSNGLKPAQSVSCLAPSRKKKPAPPPPVPIVEEKEEKSATLPASARLLDTPEEPNNKVVTNGPTSRLPISTDDQVLVTQLRTKLKAPVPRPRSTAFESSRPTQNVFLKLEGIFKKMVPEENTNAESESARLEAEIERMFDQATREHVSLESGVELSREPSPDWNWEYRLPAPPTFRDDVTSPSLADLNVAPVNNSSNGSSKGILFEPLENTEETVNEESAVKECAKKNVRTSTTDNDINITIKASEPTNGHIQINPVEKPPNSFTSKSEIIMLNSTKEKSDIPKPTLVKKTEKIYITPSTDISSDDVDNTNTKINGVIHITSKQSSEMAETTNNKASQNIIIKNQKNKENGTTLDVSPKYVDHQPEKICISIKNEEPPQDIKKNIGRAKVERSDTVIRVNGRQERTQEQSAILNELTTVITERQVKPKEIKPEPVERQVLPLKNFSITTYSGSKPVQIYKDTPKKEIKKEVNGIIRRNSSAEEKKFPLPVKRSASVVASLHRRIENSRSNSNLLEADEDPINNIRKSNLRKTISELSINNLDCDEDKPVLTKKESGLQSLQVLRTILPQLSQSQGALNTIDQINERKEEKPAVCLTTWGERPKRQVSLKTDKDYTTNEGKLETPASVSVEVVSPARVSPPAEPVVERKTRVSVYKSIETGNTKAIKLPASDLGRIPIVRSVELKKTPTASMENGFMVNVDKPFGHIKLTKPENRQMRPPSYLFGCEPTVPPPPPAPLAPTFTRQLKPVTQREIKKAPVDPREQLLESIRTFGKSSLKKVSAR